MNHNDTRTRSGTKYSAPALSKGLDILEYLAAEARPQKKIDVARALDRSISEIYRMLVTLEEREYLAFDAASERYSLTTKLFELANRYPPIRRLSQLAVEAMQELADRVNQSVHLAIHQGNHILVIAQVESPGYNDISVRLGARIPVIESASGVVLTAHLDADTRLELASRVPVTSAPLMQHYQMACEQFLASGYCQCPSMVIEGVTNLSVPVYNHAGDVAAALSIPYIRRLSTTQNVSLEQTRDELLLCGETVSRQLGSKKRARRDTRCSESPAI